MKLAELAARGVPLPWQDGGKIPWSDPAFSARMLREHLAPHDRASRRSATLDRHVGWLHAHVLGGRPAPVLDLGCGPGLYAQRLAALGHRCEGIDFSPASVAYARAEAARARLACTYRLADLRTGDFGRGFDAVLLLSGELNTFAPGEAAALLSAARAALTAKGALVLELHRESFVRALGTRPASWFTAAQSVFSDTPHLCLRESFWHAEQRAATERWYVCELDSDDFRVYTSTTQSYSDAEYTALLTGAGFAEPERYASLDPVGSAVDDGLFVRVARAGGES